MIHHVKLVSFNKLNLISKFKHDLLHYGDGWHVCSQL